MPSHTVYSSRLTGAPFLLFELKQVIHLKNKGFQDQDIRKKVKNENLFQYKRSTSVNRVLPSIMDRLAIFDDFLRENFLQGSVEDRKALNLYAIMKTDVLFHEFMMEVLQIKMADHQYYLEKKDINAFFTHKAEQNEQIASWSETSIAKLKSVYMKILFESGILKSRRGVEIKPLHIAEEIKQYLKNLGDHKFLQVIGDDGELL